VQTLNARDVRTQRRRARRHWCASIWRRVSTRAAQRMRYGLVGYSSALFASGGEGSERRTRRPRSCPVLKLRELRATRMYVLQAGGMANPSAALVKAMLINSARVPTSSSTWFYANTDHGDCQADLVRVEEQGAQPPDMSPNNIASQPTPACMCHRWKPADIPPPTQAATIIAGRLTQARRCARTSAVSFGIQIQAAAEYAPRPVSTAASTPCIAACAADMCAPASRAFGSESLASEAATGH
jgi:hypothetical protein